MKKILSTLLLGSLILVSCKKEDPAPTPETPTPTPTTPSVSASSAPQFTGSLDGTSLSYTSGCFVGYYSGGNVASSPDPSTFNYSFELYDSSFVSVIKISKGTLTVPNGGYPDNSTFGSFFPIADSSYDPSLLNGVEVSMMDGNGVEWSTKNGSADQSGSTFKILDRVEGTYNGDYQVKVKISLSCKLYDSLGNVKNLSNAIIVGAFANN